MGDIADSLINGEFDMYTGEYLGEPCGYPRTASECKSKRIKDTPAEANIRKVRKELAILIKRFKRDNKPQPVENARKYINLKYGKGWRERGLISNDPNQWKPMSEYPEPNNIN